MCQQSDRARVQYPEDLNVETFGTPGILGFSTFGTPGHSADPCVEKPNALAIGTPGISRFSTFGTPETQSYPCVDKPNALTIGTPEIRLFGHSVALEIELRLAFTTVFLYIFVGNFN